MPQQRNSEEAMTTPDFIDKPEDMINQIVLGDCLETMKRMPDGFVDLTVTSPPYLNLREYSSWNTYDDYLKDVGKWLSELYRVTKEGRHLAWNIQDNLPEPSKGHRQYHALMPDTIKIAQQAGFEWEVNIVWNKQNSTQLMMGSYPYPPTMIYAQMTESICIFRKSGKADLSRKSDDSKLSREEWGSMIRNVWNITPQTKSLHSAPFPKEIPSRLIKLHSFEGDTVYDPFNGSGTTSVASQNLNRNYIGSEISKEYCEIAEERLRQETLL